MFPIVMMMDASPWAICCVIGRLGQEQGIRSLPNNELENVEKADKKVGNMEKAYREARPVMFLSKVLDDTQSRWSQPEREAYAIFWFLTQNPHLLLGSKIFIYSDCKPIAQAFQLASTNAKVNGWILKLQEFDYEIFHIAGKLNIVSDSLSRVPRKLLVRMEQEEQRALMQYHKHEMAPKEKKAANGTVCILERHEDNLAAFMVSRNGLGRLQMQNWVYWREALFRFLVQGSFHPDLTKSERRRIQTMADQFQLKEIEKDDGRQTVRMLYHNRHEHYVPVPRDQKGIIQVMKHFHDQPCAGHYAAEMTFRKVYRAYYWPTIRIDIRN